MVRDVSQGEGLGLAEVAFSVGSVLFAAHAGIQGPLCPPLTWWDFRDASGPSGLGLSCGGPFFSEAVGEAHDLGSDSLLVCVLPL